MDPLLIGSFCAFYASKGEEVSEEAAEGAIAMWMKGEGEMVSDLIAQDPDRKSTRLNSSHRL